MAPDQTGPDDGHSVTRYIGRLRDQDPQAAGQIWQRYFGRLLPLARARLRSLPGAAADEEDVLVSVFDRFFRAVQQDRFARLENRDDLWQILLVLTERNVADHFRRAGAAKRGGGAAPAPAEAVDPADPAPGPEFVAAFNDILDHALARLDDETVREVALLRLEGYRNDEIAERLGIGLSSVERKLRVVREAWRELFGL